MDAVVENLKCECNGRIYPNNKSLNTHKKTQIHQSWVNEKTVFDLKCLCKKLENENEGLKYDLRHYRSLVIALYSENKI